MSRTFRFVVASLTFPRGRRAFMQIMAWVTDADGMRASQVEDSDTQVD